MHIIRNGFLLFGAITVPVSVCTAASRQDKKFRTLHKKCGLPISQVNQCANCQADNLTSDETARGYEFTKKNFIVLDDEVMKGIIPQRSGILKIDKCVNWEDLNELQAESHYYLKPSTVSPVLSRPYQLLANALGAKEAVGIGKASMWDKEYPIGVWSQANGVLVVSMLYCHGDVVSDLEIVEQFGLVPEEEQEFANMWVAASLRDLNPQEDLVTSQRTRTDEYIASLIQGEEFVVQPQGPEPEVTIDVMAALRKSVEMARTAA